jgi:hypothetical protein
MDLHRIPRLKAQRLMNRTTGALQTQMIFLATGSFSRTV